MNKYLVVSKSFEGFLCYAFDGLHYLMEFRNCTFRMPEEMRRDILSQLGYTLTLDMFLKWVHEQGYEFMKVADEYTFDRFYDVFNRARDRHIGVKEFGKIKTDEGRQYTFFTHEAYTYYLKANPWLTKMYVGTYLKNHARENWVKLFIQEQKDKAKK